MNEENRLNFDECKYCKLYRENGRNFCGVCGRSLVISPEKRDKSIKKNIVLQNSKLRSRGSYPKMTRQIISNNESSSFTNSRKPEKDRHNPFLKETQDSGEKEGVSGRSGDKKDKRSPRNEVIEGDTTPGEIVKSSIDIVQQGESAITPEFALIQDNFEVLQVSEVSEVSDIFDDAILEKKFKSSEMNNFIQNSLFSEEKIEEFSARFDSMEYDWKINYEEFEKRALLRFNS